MTIEEALGSLIRAGATVAPLIGGDRVYPELLPETASLPAITYQEISNNAPMAHDGEAGIEIARYQFNCWAPQPDEAKALAKALQADINGYRGIVGGDGGVKIDMIKRDNEVGDPDPGLKITRRIADYIVTYQIAPYTA